LRRGLSADLDKVSGRALENVAQGGQDRQGESFRGLGNLVGVIEDAGSSARVKARLDGRLSTSATCEAVL